MSTIVQVDNPPAASLQGTRFLRSHDAAIQAAIADSIFMGLPGIRGYWPMNQFNATYDAIDRSGFGLTLTNTATGIYEKNNLRTWFRANATDYLTRADPALLDIIGNEAQISAGDRGLTLGGWFYLLGATTGALEGFMTKWGAVGNIAYGLNGNVTPRAQFRISTDGTNIVTVTNTNTMSINKWYFIVGRFTPSTELACFVNGVKTTNLVGIPATIFNSAAAFQICARNSAAILNGRASCCFICNMSLEDYWIQNLLWHHTRAMFGE